MKNDFETLLSQFIDFIMSDGSIIVDEKRKIGKIKLTTSDERIREYFSLLCRRLFGIIPKTSKKGKCKDIWFHSYELANKLRRLTNNKQTVPSFILRKKRLQREFLRAFFSCDGGVSIISRRDGRISIKPILGEGNKKRRKMIQELLKNFNIQLHDDKHGHLMTENKRTILLFLKKIGFIEGVKPVRSKKLNLTKNQLIRIFLRHPKEIPGRVQGQKGA